MVPNKDQFWKLVDSPMGGSQKSANLLHWEGKELILFGFLFCFLEVGNQCFSSVLEIAELRILDRVPYHRQAPGAGIAYIHPSTSQPASCFPSAYLTLIETFFLGFLDVTSVKIVLNFKGFFIGSVYGPTIYRASVNHNSLDIFQPALVNRAISLSKYRTSSANWFTRQISPAIRQRMPSV